MAKLYKFLTSTVLLLALRPEHASSAVSDIFGPSTALTTRYWDCCKPSCAWSDKASSNKPIQSCDINNKPLLDTNQGTGCNGGTSFACANNSPWAVNDTFSYGFVGAYLKGGDESTWCCGCYQLSFTSGPVKGKSMIVQASNTDYDMPDQNVFTFGIPGGNTSYAGACAIQYGVPNGTFGAEKVGVASRSDCDNLPDALKSGCYWRFDWFEGAEAPTVDYKRVMCPAALTDITGCVRSDETTFGAAANGTSQPSAATTYSFPSILSSAVCVLFVSWIVFDHSL